MMWDREGRNYTGHINLMLTWTRPKPQQATKQAPKTVSALRRFSPASGEGQKKIKSMRTKPAGTDWDDSVV